MATNSDQAAWSRASPRRPSKLGRVVGESAMHRPLDNEYPGQEGIFQMIVTPPHALPSENRTWTASRSQPKMKFEQKGESQPMPAEELPAASQLETFPNP